MIAKSAELPYISTVLFGRVNIKMNLKTAAE